MLEVIGFRPLGVRINVEPAPEPERACIPPRLAPSIEPEEVSVVEPSMEKVGDLHRLSEKGALITVAGAPAARR